jgi:CubicO group peptidase (beta-lactamase class C family)
VDRQGNVPSTKLVQRITRGLACAAAAAAAWSALPPAHAGERSADTPRFEFGRAVDEAETLLRLHSLLVSWNGDLVLERYFNGTQPGDVANVKSVSKSVISALIGIAIGKGYIEGIDEPIGAYFDGLLDGAQDARKRGITIENLLTMQSGLETTSNRHYGAWVLSSNWVAYALRRPLEEPPGTRMVYSTGNTHLLSAILTRATGESTLQFARQTLARPLGFELAPWTRDPQGIYLGGNNMGLTPRQMLSFGELYLNDGRVEDKEVVPASWVEASLRPRTESTREHGRYYGYGWWIRHMGGLEADYAWGYGGQFIILVPSLNLVVVTTADSTPGPDRRGYRRRIQNMIENLIVAPASSALQGPTVTRAD